MTQMAVVVDVAYSRVPEYQIGLASNQILLGRAPLASGETVSLIAGTVGDFDAAAFQTAHSPLGKLDTPFRIEPLSEQLDDLRGLIFLPLVDGGPLCAVEVGPNFDNLGAKK